MKFLTAVLTSRDLKECERTVLSIPDTANILICVNSRNAAYEYDVRESEICNKHTIISTPSDGSPGTGKNSILEYFCTTDYDRLLMIDGDDFYLPGGHDLLVQTLSDNPDIDVLGLQGEVLLLKDSCSYWKDLDLPLLLDTAQVKNINDVGNVIEALAMSAPLTYKNGWTFHRIVAYNKQAAEKIRFTSQITFEDLIASCDIQLMHDKGELNFTLFESQNVYVYDRRNIEGESTRMLRENEDYHSKFILERYTEEQLARFPEIVLPILYDMRPITNEDREKIVYEYLEKIG